jgi:ATP phosphoribosyltransferase regulatory subunit
MNDQEKNPALLPSGFVDLLPPDAEQEAGAITALMALFRTFGFQRVKPPLVEFEESLFAPGPGAVLAAETFRIVDPISHRVMGVRSDITAQIARIAATRLVREERPLRLMYANDVLRTRGSQQRTERQFCQVGCEIIGRAADEADIEICVISLQGLKALGIKNVTIDLTMPRLIEGILAAHAVQEDGMKDIKSALADRDAGRLKNCEGPLQDILRTLLAAAGPAEKALRALGTLNLPEKTGRDLEKLGTVYQGIARACRDLGYDDVAVTIDPVECHGYEYEQGISFCFFAQGVHGELGRGGRYDIVFGAPDKTESATGFTLYMDTVRKATAKPMPSRTIFVPAGESWSLIRKFQDEGWTVIRGTGQNKSRGKCTHEYKDGQIQETT